MMRLPFSVAMEKGLGVEAGLPPSPAHWERGWGLRRACPPLPVRERGWG